MLQYLKSKTFAGLVGAVAALAVFAVFAMSASAQDKNPIKIGFGMAQTGPLGPNGKSALLAMEIWAEETNAKGGLLGRPVKLVYYDDKTNPSGAGHLHQAARRRQSRPHRRRLRHQHASAGHADRHAKEEAVPRA